MTPPVIAALIAAMASVIVAAFAWMTARRSALAQLEQQRKLEALRLAQAELAPGQAAANVLWENLQKLKHALDILLVDNHPEVEDAVEVVRDAAYALSKDYAHQGPLLPTHIQGMWHGIKNQGLDLIKLVDEYKNIARFDRMIPPEEKGRILAVRHSLTERQRALERELADHKIELHKKYVDLLRPGVEL